MVLNGAGVASRGHLTIMSGDVFGCASWGSTISSSRQRPVMLSNTLQGTA